MTDKAMVDPLNTKAIEAAKSAVIGNPLNDEQIHRMISAYLSALPAVDGGEEDATLEKLRAVEATYPEYPVLLEAIREAASLLSSQKGEIERLTKERDEYRTAVSSPEAVIANMKRGAIAVPSIRFLIDLHGESALSTWDKASAAESRVLSLEEENARLREALKPFGEYLNEMPFDLDNNGKPLPDDTGPGWTYLTAGDFRRARSALQEKQNG